MAILVDSEDVLVEDDEGFRLIDLDVNVPVPVLGIGLDARGLLGEALESICRGGICLGDVTLGEDDSLLLLLLLLVEV